jgi:hypothetical protein
MQQKVNSGRPLMTKARIIENHLEAAWLQIERDMTLEEFTAAAYEAAAAICLRNGLRERIASGAIKVRSHA